MTEVINTENINTDIKELFETVVAGGYCVGCGACAAVQNSPVKMALDQYGVMQASIDDSYTGPALTESVQSVCPFSNKSDNEDVIGERLFAADSTYINKIGYYQATYAGHVAEGDYRKNGSSGGMGSWIASTLFKEGLVDGVINIHQRQPTADDKRLFHYQLSDSLATIAHSSKSRYYPIEVSEMIKLIRERPGRYLLVGVPCFIKAVRLLSFKDPVLNDRIKFCMGLICGHLKSTRFAEMLAWQTGIKPAQLTAINFRTKLEGLNANKYGITATGIVNGEDVVNVSPSVGQLYGTNWGLGFFKYKSCDYCDDVVAETADVTIGDAWLPQYLNDSNGTNILIIRNPVIKALVEKAEAEQRLVLDKITPQDAIQSQSSGFNHRREGLSYRLYLADQKNEWRPIKRVEANNTLDEKTQNKQKLRIEMAKESHIAMNVAIEQQKFNTFKELMEPIVQDYQLLYKRPLWRRVASKIKHIIKL
jgi:coenzyme F420 hydrogenase subunit beta